MMVGLRGSWWSSVKMDRERPSELSHEEKEELQRLKEGDEGAASCQCRSFFFAACVRCSSPVSYVKFLQLFLC